jgi:hypothetical protein
VCVEMSTIQTQLPKSVAPVQSYARSEKTVRPATSVFPMQERMRKESVVATLRCSRSVISALTARMGAAHVLMESLATKTPVKRQ